MGDSGKHEPFHLYPMRQAIEEGFICDVLAGYHGKTVAPPTDPNLLFDTRHDLDAFGVLDIGEMQRTARLLLGEGNHAQVDAALQPAVDRFNGLGTDDQDAFRDALGRFVRVYGFLSLVVAFRNPELERDYLFCRALGRLVRDRDPGQRIDLGSEVELTHLRHEPAFEGSVELPKGECEVATIFSGTGPAADPRAGAPVGDHRPHQRTLRHGLDRTGPPRVPSRR